MHRVSRLHDSMRFAYTVERWDASTRLGLRLRGCAYSSMPLAIEAIIPRGLIDVTNKWKATGSEPIPILQPDDIILSVNGSTKEQHGMPVVWTTLATDRQLVFAILRGEYDPWDITRLPPEVPCKEPPGRCEAAQENKRKLPEWSLLRYDYRGVTSR